MSIKIIKAQRDELRELHRLQVAAFTPLLEKYQDYSTNPANEKLERVEERFSQSNTIYYFISYKGKNIGAIRVIEKIEEGEVRISPMFIHPQYQNLKLGQKAVYELEKLYPNVTKWSLDTILQENRLCHFYESLGYVDTGRRDNIKDGMDIIHYKKVLKVFGNRGSGISYVGRDAVYGICLKDNRIASVKVGSSYFLPGGGIEEGETPKEALIREFKEELGWCIHIRRYITTAREYFSSLSSECYYNSRARFYLVEYIKDSDNCSEKDHQLEWLRFDQRDTLQFEYFRWAVEQVLS